MLTALKSFWGNATTLPYLEEEEEEEEEEEGVEEEPLLRFFSRPARAALIGIKHVKLTFYTSFQDLVYKKFWSLSSQTEELAKRNKQC